MFFIPKYIKIIFFLKKLFLISTYQNNLKTSKNIDLKQKQKINNFFQKKFQNIMQNIPLKENGEAIFTPWLMLGLSNLG